MSQFHRQENGYVAAKPLQTIQVMYMLWKTMVVLLLATIALLVTGRIQAADYKNGIRIYAENCEYCHGPSGEGMGGMGGMGELRAWDQLMKTDEDLFAIIRDGKTVMPGYDGLLTSEEILDVISYMRTFR